VDEELMATAYRLPRKYRYRYRPRRKGITREQSVAIVFAALLAAGGTRASAAAHHGGAAAQTASAAAARNAAASGAVAYARSQLGKPYLWGGTGPGAFDCSGLVMKAYRSAGVSIERTSQRQWASERHVPASRVRAGDLVFFAGADGTMTSPGHVGIVIGGGKMIEAYGAGYPVRVAGYDRPDLAGFTDPASLAVVTAAIRTSVPGGAGYTPSSWAAALLTAGGWPRTSCNLAAVTGWERREGGGWGNQASFNPLNINPGARAGWPGHSVTGAWAFPDAAIGLRYTVMVLNSSRYGGIRAALRAGNSAQAVCDAIMASPWAASHYDGTLTATC
jgi:cell wall-associated NlpC family hydrolase